VAGGADADSVLLHAEGAGGDIPFGHPLATAEIYDPKTKTFAPTGSMSEAHSSFTPRRTRRWSRAGDRRHRRLRSRRLEQSARDLRRSLGRIHADRRVRDDDRLHHAATRLADGRALIFGGKKSNVSFLSDLQIFDPVTGVFDRAGRTFSSRTVANVVPTVDGGAVVLGGLSCSFNGCDNPVETFLVAAGGGTSDGPDLLHGRASASATVLLDGSILVAGGYASSSVAFVERLAP